MVYKKVGEFKTFSPIPRQLLSRILVQFTVYEAVTITGMLKGVPDMKAEAHYIEPSGRIVQNAILSREEFLTLFDIDLADYR